MSIYVPYTHTDPSCHGNTGEEAREYYNSRPLVVHSDSNKGWKKAATGRLAYVVGYTVGVWSQIKSFFFSFIFWAIHKPPGSPSKKKIWIFLNFFFFFFFFFFCQVTHTTTGYYNTWGLRLRQGEDPKILKPCLTLYLTVERRNAQWRCVWNFATLHI